MSLTSQIMKIMNNTALAFRGTTVAEAVGQPSPAAQKPFMQMIQNEQEYNPDAETEELMKPVMNPVIAFHEALRAKDTSKISEGNPFKGQKITVAEAWLFEGMFDPSGKIAEKKARESKGVRWPASYRIRHIVGNDDYKKTLESSRDEWDKKLPAKVKQAVEANRVREAVRKRLIEAKLVENGFEFGVDSGGSFGPYDPNQYTEFAPTYGGPFFKQLYLTDYLRMHSLAFETWNHNPIAKRIIELMAQYSFGRRFKVRIKDPKKNKAWVDFDTKYAIRENCSKYWVREYCIYGEIMLNIDTWMLIDPSTVWDIITNPDNLREVYYYYQCYPTAYQMFTGFNVPGEPGSAKVPGQEYIIRQVPAYKVIHKKGNCVSNEKRGRSLFFPVLGWLKRVKDLYNAVVVRQWLLSCFIWDDTVQGNAADINAHAAQYARMPTPGSTFVHNSSVTRQAMPAIDTAGGKNTGSGIGSEIIAFIATAVGIPKEFLNVMQSSGGGSRATALTSAEPFTKVIEDLQATFEELLIAVCKIAFAQAGQTYVDGDVEFIFPSVTKDTTTETVKNIATGEALGYIAKQTAAEMYAGEMNITSYNFLDEQTKVTKEIQKGLNQTSASPMPPGGRLGDGSSPDDGSGSTVGDPAEIANEDEDGENSVSPIHGQGKVDLSSQLKKI